MKFLLLFSNDKPEKLPTMQEDLTEILCAMLDHREDWHMNEYVAVNIETGAVLWHACKHHERDFYVNLPNVGKVEDFTKKQYKRIAEKLALARHWRALQQLQKPCPTHTKVLEVLTLGDKVAEGYYKDEVFNNAIREVFRDW